jgi:hypothetical protein
MVSENYRELHKDIGRDCLEVKYGGVLPNKLSDFFPPDMHMLGEKMIDDQPPKLKQPRQAQKSLLLPPPEPSSRIALQLQAFTYTIDNNNLVDYNDEFERVRHEFPLITRTGYLYR